MSQDPEVPPFDETRPMPAAPTNPWATPAPAPAPATAPQPSPLDDDRHRWDSPPSSMPPPSGPPAFGPPPPGYQAAPPADTVLWSRYDDAGSAAEPDSSPAFGSDADAWVDRDRTSAENERASSLFERYDPPAPPGAEIVAGLSVPALPPPSGTPSVGAPPPGYDPAPSTARHSAPASPPPYQAPPPSGPSFPPPSPPGFGGPPPSTYDAPPSAYDPPPAAPYDAPPPPSGFDGFAAGFAPQPPAGPGIAPGQVAGERAESAKNWAEGMVAKHGARNLTQLAVPAFAVLGVLWPPMMITHNFLWAIFAVVAAVVTLTGRKPGAASWTTAAAGTGAYFVFWVLIALPSISGANGFFLTAALAAAVTGLALHPDKRW
ncbi:MAG: hypothetical protein U0Q19_04810 [Kineosporiaceae bacterium]